MALGFPEHHLLATPGAPKARNVDTLGGSSPPGPRFGGKSWLCGAVMNFSTGIAAVLAPKACLAFLFYTHTEHFLKLLKERWLCFSEHFLKYSKKHVSNSLNILIMASQNIFVNVIISLFGVGSLFRL